MKKLKANWQTSSIGLSMIGLTIIHLVFAIRAGNATEGVWTASFGTVMGGIGLLFAGDASKSATKEEVQAVAQNTAAAIKTGDTSTLTNPTPPPQAPKP
jgi:hypothetical protein